MRMYGAGTMQTGNTLRVVTFLLLVIACTLPGCTTKKVYPGPELPPDEVALVTWKSYLWNPTVNIEAIDGMKRGTWERNFAVKPGKHTVTDYLAWCIDSAYYHHCDYKPHIDMHLEAEANHKYIVHGENWSNPRYWIEDEGTRQVVDRYPE